MHKFCSECGQRVDLAPPYGCPHCGFRFWANSKPCAGVLVEHRGEILLIRRAIEPWFGEWDIPGGFVDAGEHPEDGARRELLEETGLDLPVVSLLGMWMDTYGDTSEADKMYPQSLLNMFYLAQIPDDHERPTPTVDPAEASEYGWFSPDDLPSPIGFPNHQPAVIAAWVAKRSGGEEFAPLPARSD